MLLRSDRRSGRIRRRNAVADFHRLVLELFCPLEQVESELFPHVVGVAASKLNVEGQRECAADDDRRFLTVLEVEIFRYFDVSAIFSVATESIGLGRVEVS